MDALSPLMKAERLVIRPAELPRLAPDWLLSNTFAFEFRWQTDDYCP